MQCRFQKIFAKIALVACRTKRVSMFFCVVSVDFKKIDERLAKNTYLCRFSKGKRGDNWQAFKIE